MTKAGNSSGLVYTFYSYKGGAGRSMALANVATLLSQWGHKTLVVDWDLEAPGIEGFFSGLQSIQSGLQAIEGTRIRKSTKGIVDLIHAWSEGDKLNWRDCLIEFDGRAAMITAGLDDGDYANRLHKLDFEYLFEKKNLGSYIEQLRSEWISEFDFVLIDSRTGVTDIGGICTVHLPDILVVFFTATNSSVNGTVQVIQRARVAQGRLPLDRGHLLVVPIPSRDESRTEYEQAQKWKEVFVTRFQDSYKDWIPKGVTPLEAVETLRIPYIPYWSFGERLPVEIERTSDQSSLSYAYDTLARLLAARLDWIEAFRGRSLSPPPVVNPRQLDLNWLQKHRNAAIRKFSKSKKHGFMEAYHFCLDPIAPKQQDKLLEIAKQAAVHTFGWPIGVVFANNEKHRPTPSNEGIVADIVTDHEYDYWALKKNGDFYTLMSLFEDSREEGVIYFNTRIIRVTELIMHCRNLYKGFGAEPSVRISLTVRHRGLKNRGLTATKDYLPTLPRFNKHEEEVSTTVSFILGISDTEIVETVKELCEPLFLLFDFERFEHHVYESIVKSFLNGKVT